MSGAAWAGVFPPIKTPPVAPEPVLSIGPVTVTNSMLGSLVGLLVVVTLVWLATRRLDRRPGKVQVLVEMTIGGLYNFAKSAGGSGGAALFPLFAGLFLWLLVNNWIALIPGFGQVTVCCKDGESFPLFRAMNSDFNSPLALALMVVLLIHISGVRTHGLRYFAEFINIPALLKGGVIDFIVGLIHSIGEFAKIISLTFRLWANIYGGELLIAVVLGLIGPVAVVFYGFEFALVAVVQSIIFGLLALIYISLVSQHAEHPGEHGEEGSHVATQKLIGGDAEQATAPA